MARPFLSRQERFPVVGSTNDIVRDWLDDGTPEVCLAVADEQSHGRGREGRTWTAPRGAGLLLSLGFRPVWLEPEQAWRLAATASLAMAEAAEDVAGVPAGTFQLKWPNDLVTEAVVGAEADWKKLGGVLGETDGLGTADPRAIVGMGINADWPRSEFPAELAPSMTSLREVAGRRVAPATLLAAFLPRLEAGIVLLRAGRFEAGEWRARQATTGRQIRLDYPDGRSDEVEAVGVDAETGALLVDDGSATEPQRILSAEVRHVRTAASQQRTTARV
jgi:BirA family transcriptional regulator, biotin operon repressor / biotin---[acetyl-CoA-carboxylase] ligase